METVFNFTKQKPLIKINDYKYIDCHNSFSDINYYIRKYDSHNNYEFMEAKIGGIGKKLFNKYVLLAGTSIKILDSLMFSYLKHRKDTKLVVNNKFVELALKENNFNEVCSKEVLKFYSNNVPKEIMKSDYYKKALEEGFKVLYTMNNETKDIKFSKCYLVMYKELQQEFANTELSYVCFKTAECTTRPSYVKGESKEKYFIMEMPSLNIPTSILK